MSDKGQLFVVGTPIGNLEDITLRAISTLQNVDMILAEDTRNSKKIFNHYDITTPLSSFHKYNEHKTFKKYIEKN